MQLEKLREITFLDLNEDDLLPTCRFLWSIAPDELKEKLKPILLDALVKGADIELPKEMMQPLYENLQAFREGIFRGRARSIDLGDELFDKYLFCRDYLDYNDASLL